MIALPGYTLTEMIHEGAETLVYRGVRDSDGALIVAKLFKSEHPRPRELAKLQHEYTLLRSLDIPGVIKAYALEKYGNGLALIVQGIDAQPLSRRIAEGALAIPTALTVALRLAEILESLHEGQIVHKDIKPHKVPAE